MPNILKAAYTNDSTAFCSLSKRAPLWNAKEMSQRGRRGGESRQKTGMDKAKHVSQQVCGVEICSLTVWECSGVEGYKGTEDSWGGEVKEVEAGFADWTCDCLQVLDIFEAYLDNLQIKTALPYLTTLLLRPVKLKHHLPSTWSKLGHFTHSCKTRQCMSSTFLYCVYHLPPSLLFSHAHTHLIQTLNQSNSDIPSCGVLP